jgi:hypothetical protein
MEPADLGSLILERKYAAGVWFAIGWPVAGVLGGAGAVLLSQDAANVTTATVLWAVGGLCLFLPLLLPSRRLRFHERGLVDRRPLRAPFVLPYERVERMDWEVYKPRVGVTLQARLVGGGRRIDFMVRMDTGGRVEQGLERVRDHIASHMAVALLARVQADGAVAWGSAREGGVRLHREGLAYRPTGFLGKGPEQVVPWETPFEYLLRDGVLAVRRTGAVEALFTLPCTATDFYPGFVVFTSLGEVRPIG